MGSWPRYRRARRPPQDGAAADGPARHPAHQADPTGAGRRRAGLASVVGRLAGAPRRPTDRAGLSKPGGYLQRRYGEQGWSVRRMRAELGVGGAGWSPSWHGWTCGADTGQESPSPNAALTSGLVGPPRAPPARETDTAERWGVGSLSRRRSRSRPRGDGQRRRPLLGCTSPCPRQGSIPCRGGGPPTVRTLACRDRACG
jgi:hypothetical protein